MYSSSITNLSPPPQQQQQPPSHWFRGVQGLQPLPFVGIFNKKKVILSLFRAATAPPPPPSPDLWKENWSSEATPRPFQIFYIAIFISVCVVYFKHSKYQIVDGSQVSYIGTPRVISSIISIISSRTMPVAFVSRGTFNLSSFVLMSVISLTNIGTRSNEKL